MKKAGKSILSVLCGLSVIGLSSSYGGDLVVEGNLTVETNLVVDGSTTFNSDVSVNADVQIGAESTLEVAVGKTFTNGQYGINSYLQNVGRTFSAYSSQGTCHQFLLFADGSYTNAMFALSSSLNGNTYYPRFTVLQNGLIGIGTDAPTELLDVTGTVRAASFIGDGSGLTNLSVSSLSGTVSSSQIAGDAIVTEKIQDGTIAVSDLNTNEVDARYVMKSGDTITGDLNVDGTTTLDGNVGIGTTSPSAKLDVAGTLHVSDRATFDEFLRIDSEGTPYMDHGIYGTNYGYVQVYGYKPYYINPNGNDVIICRDSGNVGIGTTSPDTALDVIGNMGSQFRLANTENDLTAKHGYLNVRHYDNSERDFTLLLGSALESVNRLTIGGGTSVGNSATEIKFNTAEDTTTFVGTTRMYIGSGGNVGIGTTYPANKLEVSGTVKATSYQGDGGSLYIPPQGGISMGVYTNTGN